MNKLQRTKIYGLVILISICLTMPGLGQYQIKQSAFSNAASPVSDGANFKLQTTGGQAAIGKSESDTYSMRAGYWYIPVSPVTGIDDDPFDLLPVKFELYQNYPNPFNPVTNIKFALPKPSEVKIEIYNVLGQRVLMLINENRPAGYHIVQVNANRLSSGVYFYRIQADHFSRVRKMMLVK